ncbi:MAG: histidine kinase N-terminal 7TM domain-containing protein, partial [Candidatus Pacebacteria bacterium]|nr:histidine kinase N-terminal 7TM domain-containing protein [Candidatus Paceibacterota bacterium]
MFVIFEQIILFLISILTIFFGVWVYLQDRKNKLNRWFAIASFCILGWVNFAYFGSASNEVLKSTFWYRLNWGIVPLFIFSFYLFTSYYSKRIIRFWDKANLFGLLILSFLSFFTNLIIKQTVIEKWGAEVIFGSFGIFYKFFTFFVTLFILKYLLSYYFLTSKNEKLKVQYFILGVIFFALGNIIFNVILPTALDTVKYQHLGDFSAVFFLGFTAYAIVKKELFGIKVVLTQILVVILALLILIQTIFTPSLEWKIINGAMFVFFIFFGIYLIKAVKNEEKRTKKAEEVAKEEKRLREKSEELIKDFERLSDAKNQFIMATQHHLRTPLTSMRGYLDLIGGGSFGKVPKKLKAVL